MTARKAVVVDDEDHATCQRAGVQYDESDMRGKCSEWHADHGHMRVAHGCAGFNVVQLYVQDSCTSGMGGCGRERVKVAPGRHSGVRMTGHTRENSGGSAP
eukprot:2821592-Prymnesium_polylepis.1